MTPFLLRERMREEGRKEGGKHLCMEPGKHATILPVTPGELALGEGFPHLLYTIREVVVLCFLRFY